MGGYAHWATFGKVYVASRGRSASVQSRIGCRSSGLGDDARLDGRMTSRFFPRDEYFMRLALREAERSVEHDDVPVGCVIAHEGEVLASAPNERELRGDPTAHCEVLALREAARRLGSWRLSGAVLYVTLEPCAMCAGAIVLARVPAGGVRRARPQGGRGRQRARRAGRAAPESQARRGRRPARRRVRGAPAAVLLAPALRPLAFPPPSPGADRGRTEGCRSG